MTEHDLTADERRAIAALKRVAKRWPESLMLVGGGGRLAVVRTDDYESGALLGAGGRGVIDDVDIPADGGDPW